MFNKKYDKCYDCGVLLADGYAQKIKGNGNTYCRTHRKPYDRVDIVLNSETWDYEDGYFKEFRVDENGKIIK